MKASATSAHPAGFQVATSACDAQARYSSLVTVILFIVAFVMVGATVAGPGLSWDEPAYRHSQVTLQWWLHELRHASSWGEVVVLFTPDAIRQYWEFNRFGHNFHPPMGSYLNLASFFIFGSWIDDIASRRLASVAEFAAVVAMLGHWIGRRYGTCVGVLAAASLLTMPRLVGDAHVIGTDMPLLLFWAATVLAFLPALKSTRWQPLFAACWACLFLVKFTAMALVFPFGLLLALQWVGTKRTEWIRWAFWMLLASLPITPLAWTIVLGAAHGSDAFAAWGMRNANWVSSLFLWPGLVWLAYRHGCWRRRVCRLDPALELPWMTLALAPILCILLNPTWWHEPAAALSRYCALNLFRQESLPDIGIYYLGRRYLYSLPWHNAFVLMAVTIPWGALLLGLAGVAVAVVRFRCDRFPAMLLLFAMTLPLLRMLPTPAHDGVRLFLPTFFFWAGLAGIGAAAIIRTLPLQFRATAWTLLFLIGPVWAGGQWARIHPYELSYYNIGLPRAIDCGFEATYWYDAVTPRVLDDLNRTDVLPQNVSIGFPDRLINLEVFDALQSLGRLRADINSRLGQSDGFPWIWLLTHSSKATAFTKLLFACRPRYENGFDGVRLFSVVDDRAVARAWALHTLCVVLDDSRRLGPLVVNDSVFECDRVTIRAAIDLVRPNANLDARAGRKVRELADNWRKADNFVPNIERVQRASPAAIDWAIEIVSSRPADVRKVLNSAGYLRPELFGGYFDADQTFD